MHLHEKPTYRSGSRSFCYEYNTCSVLKASSYRYRRIGYLLRTLGSRRTSSRDKAASTALCVFVVVIIRLCFTAMPHFLDSSFFLSLSLTRTITGSQGFAEQVTNEKEHKRCAFEQNSASLCTPVCAVFSSLSNSSQRGNLSTECTTFFFRSSE